MYALLIAALIALDLTDPFEAPYNYDAHDEIAAIATVPFVTGATKVSVATGAPGLYIEGVSVVLLPGLETDPETSTYDLRVRSVGGPSAYETASIGRVAAMTFCADTSTGELMTQSSTIGQYQWVTGSWENLDMGEPTADTYLDTTFTVEIQTTSSCPALQSQVLGLVATVAPRGSYFEDVVGGIPVSYAPGWTEGNVVTVIGRTYTFDVTASPDYGVFGSVAVTITSSATGCTSSSVFGEMRNSGGGLHQSNNLALSAQWGGAGCPNLTRGWNSSSDLTFGRLVVKVENQVVTEYWPPGAPLHVDGTDDVTTVATLTRAGPLDSVVWRPQSSSLEDIDGYCTSVQGCLERCTFEWLNFGWVPCLFDPTISMDDVFYVVPRLTPFNEDVRYMFGQAVAGVIEMLDAARDCHDYTLDLGPVGDVEMPFCALYDPEAAWLVWFRRIFMLVFGYATIMTTVRLVFWAMGWSIPEWLDTFSGGLREEKTGD